MNNSFYRVSDETEFGVRAKLNLSERSFAEIFQSLEQKALVKKSSDGKLSVAPWGLRQVLSLDEYKFMDVLLGLQMVDPRHPAIAVAPGILNGRPHLAGTRIAVDDIVTLFHADQGPKEILQAYPHLTRYDIEAALAFHYSQQTPTALSA